MAGERTMWLVWRKDAMRRSTIYPATVFKTEEEARAWLTRCAPNWCCSQITVKETDDE